MKLLFLEKFERNIFGPITRGSRELSAEEETILQRKQFVAKPWGGEKSFVHLQSERKKGEKRKRFTQYQSRFLAAMVLSNRVTQNCNWVVFCAFCSSALVISPPLPGPTAQLFFSGARPSVRIPTFIFHHELRFIFKV
jgi:hypothetical protein